MGKRLLNQLLVALVYRSRVAHRRLIRSSGSHPLFSPTLYQSDITVMGLGQGSRVFSSPAETFLWQLEGSAVIILGTEEIRLRRDETLLIPSGKEFEYLPSSEAMTLSTVMDPQNKTRV